MSSLRIINDTKEKKTKHVLRCTYITCIQVVFIIVYRFVSNFFSLELRIHAGMYLPRVYVRAYTYIYIYIHACARGLTVVCVIVRTIISREPWSLERTTGMRKFGKRTAKDSQDCIMRARVPT